MTAVERRFETSYREADTDEPGLVIEDDGTIWKVAPGGTRTELGGESGGPQPFSVLGPFHLTYADLDPVAFVDLGALADDTIIWRVAVFRRELFSHAGEHVKVKLAQSNGSNDVVLADVDVITPEAEHDNPASAVAAVEGPDNEALARGTLVLPPAWVGIAQHDAHLLVENELGTNSQGIIDIYALISAPS